MALFAFNIGIEFGQIVLLTALLSMTALWRWLPAMHRLRPLRPLAAAFPAYLIGTLAAYWCLDRAALLLH